MSGPRNMNAVRDVSSRYDIIEPLEQYFPNFFNSRPISRICTMFARVARKFKALLAMPQ